VFEHKLRASNGISPITANVLRKPTMF